MAESDPYLDPEAVHDLQAARDGHAANLRKIPLGDVKRFVDACAEYEQRLETILQANAARRDGSGNGNGNGRLMQQQVQDHDGHADDQFPSPAAGENADGEPGGASSPRA